MTGIVAFVGPTASGKTALAVNVAQRLGAEIISADSMQVYRGMEIGAGAPSADELASVPHHFIGHLEPSDSWSAGQFERQAAPIARRLNQAGKPAVVAGGSGLYVRALIDGLFDGPPVDPDIRRTVQQECEAFGNEVMFERLEAADPEYAAVIEPGDARRIVRALEVLRQTGKPLSQWHREYRSERPRFDAKLFAIDWPRAELYERVNRRVDAMLEAGLLGEVRQLIAGGYETEIARIRSLGYREMAAYLRGELSLEEATGQMKMKTRRFAKRQLTWFRPDPRVEWLTPPAGDDWEPLAAYVLGRINAAAESPRVP